MPLKTMILAATGLASLISVNVMTSQPAEARPACLYHALDPLGKIMADGHAWAAKKSWACNRAERRCKRELERKRRHGKAGRGSCKRVTNY